MGFQLQRRIGKHRIKFIEKMQNRLSAKHIVKNFKELDKLIRDKIPHDIRVSHEVELALKEEEAAAKQLEGTMDASAVIYRNLFVDHDAELQEVEEWEKEIIEYLARYKGLLKKRGGDNPQIKKELAEFDKEFKHLLSNDMRKEEQYLRNEYKDFMNLIDAAEHPEKGEFMESVKALWKNEDASYLDYFLIKQEQKRMMSFIAKEKNVHKATIEHLKVLVEMSKNAVEKGNTDGTQILHDRLIVIGKDVRDMAKYIDTAAKKAYLVVKRVVILDFSVLALAKELLQGNYAFVKEVLAPSEPIMEINKEIDKNVFKAIDATIREYAEAIRIDLRLTQNISKLAA